MGTYDYLDEKKSERRLRRALRAASEEVSENQWLLPVAGAVLGLLFALVSGRTGGNPDPNMWSITVDEARSSICCGPLSDRTRDALGSYLF